MNDTQFSNVADEGVNLKYFMCTKMQRRSICIVFKTKLLLLLKHTVYEHELFCEIALF
jgi:hypothetical protein